MKMLLITYFFGVFGVHKFMQGKKKEGIIYLCTFGIFGIGWVIDVFKATYNLFVPPVEKEVPSDSISIYSSFNEKLNLQKGVTENTVLSLKKEDINLPHNKIQPSNHSFNIHPDIANLIWIGDGDYKNYEMDSTNINNNIYLQIGRGEPSTLYLNLPISKPADKTNVHKPDYYPSYEGLSPEQRWMYWEFLSNPYNPNIDIGYVFLFYYGLERFILKNDRNDAFHMVLKLRKIHMNSSFQAYTLDHLLYACITKNRNDWAECLIELIASDQNISASSDLGFILKYQIGIPLYESEIVQCSRRFGFNNRRYINMYPDMFAKKLKDLLINTYGTPYIMLNKFFNDDNIKKLEKNTLPICANYSLSPREYQVPNIFSNETFRLSMFKILQETHETVKKELAILRKSQK